MKKKRKTPPNDTGEPFPWLGRLQAVVPSSKIEAFMARVRFRGHSSSLQFRFPMDTTARRNSRAGAFPRLLIALACLFLFSFACFAQGDSDVHISPRKGPEPAKAADIDPSLKTHTKPY